jgi:hypothetical protein
MTKQSTLEHIQVREAALEIQRKVFMLTYQFKQLDQRRGQALMNALRTAAPDLYEILSGSPEDCFYDDSKFFDAIAALGFDRAMASRLVSSPKR